MKKTYYQICRFPQNKAKGRYLVRKIIYLKNNEIIQENYKYSEKNLKRLYREINKMNYSYECYDLSNFDDIGIPNYINSYSF